MKGGGEGARKKLFLESQAFAQPSQNCPKISGRQPNSCTTKGRYLQRENKPRPLMSILFLRRPEIT